MQSTMYGLVDCNNFFVSCERVFNPKLRDIPVVVLSNNDGCVISRSNEAKKLGIAMGEPFFKIRDLVYKNNVVALSSNFALYGDLSARVMSVITNYFPDVSIYSIDEAFIDLSTLQQNFDLYASCLELSNKIDLYTGIPVSIGIANTKTLAKVANYIAKQNNTERVVFLKDTTAVLSGLPVEEVWGIGRKLKKRLHAMGVFTALELIKLPESFIKNNFNIMLRRTISELQGTSCIQLKDSEQNKRQIMVSRSFGQRVTEIEVIQEALATYASIACEKMRKQGSVTGGFYVFLRTGVHGDPESIYKDSLYIKLAHPTADTREIIKNASFGLQKIFKKGFRYQKVGIILGDLSDSNNMQIDLFGHTNLQSSETLMGLIDNINQKFGRNTIQFAAAGIEKEWRGNSNKKSGGFVADWDDLLVVGHKKPE